MSIPVIHRIVTFIYSLGYSISMKTNNSSEANQMKTNNQTIDKLINNSKYAIVSERTEGNLKYIKADIKIGYNTITANICYNSETNKYAGLIEVYQAQHKEIVSPPRWEDMSIYNRNKAIEQREQKNKAYIQALYKVA